jgi:predicted CXXCH cytochrome family protein
MRRIMRVMEAWTMRELRLGPWLSIAIVWTIMMALPAAVATGQTPADEIPELETEQAKELEEYEPIDSSVCTDCHEESAHGSDFNTDLEHSVHAGFLCLDCHLERLRRREGEEIEESESPEDKGV